MEIQAPPAATGIDTDFDKLNRDWYIDKAVQILVFIGGISAIVFIVGIFIFISKEGFGFLVVNSISRSFSSHPIGGQPRKARRPSVSSRWLPVRQVLPAWRC